MAKRGSTALATRAPVIVAVPTSRRARAGRAVRRYGRKAGSAARRGARALARGAWEEKFALGAIVGSGLVGYLEGDNKLDFVPDLGIGRVPTLAAGLYFGGRAFKSDKMRMAGIGLAAAAAFQFGLEKGRR